MKTIISILKTGIYIVLLILTCSHVKGQDRIDLIKGKLDSLSLKQIPSLKQKTEISVSGVSFKELVTALAEANDLNISVDPSINLKVVNSFNNETVENILLFLCKDYNLTIDFTGSIMAFRDYSPPKSVKIVPLLERIHYEKDNDLVSLDLHNDTLSKITKLLTILTGKNVLALPQISDRQINIFLKNVPFDEAMDKLSLVNDILFTKTNDNFYILSLPEANASKAMRTIGRATAGINKDNFTASIEKDKKGNDILVVNALNTPIKDVINGISNLLGINYFLFSDPVGNTTTSIACSSYNEFLGHLLEGTDYTFKEQNNVYLIGKRNLEGLREAKVLKLQFRSADTVITLIPSDIKTGVDIKSFPELNSLILTGSKIQIDEIEDFVKQIDKVVPMILIEAWVIDVNKVRSTSTGISAGLSDTVKTGGSIFPGINFTFSSSSINSLLNIIANNGVINLGRVAPNFYVSLSALENQNDINIRSTPQLSTLNGHSASLKIGTTDYYVQQTSNIIGNLSPQTVTTQQYIPVKANMEINIRPVVSGDDEVTLNIDVELSSFGTRSSPQAPPTISTREFKSLIRIKNEEMVVLGGLDETEKNVSASGVPLLMRIPILKYLFSQRTHTRTNTKLLVFIKPTIIY